MTYNDQLLTPEWGNKRKEIIDRDNGQCQICLSQKELHVHHKTYLSNRMAWDYPSELLITLCGSCHSLFHAVERSRFIFKEDILEIAKRTSQSVSALAALDRQIGLKEVENFIKRTEHG